MIVRLARSSVFRYFFYLKRPLFLYGYTNRQTSRSIAVADPGEGPGGPGPPYFLTKLMPTGRKIFFFEATPSLSQGLDDRARPPPPVPRYLKFWIRHCNAVKIRVALSLC